MAKIAELEARLTANTAEFDAAFDAAEERVDRLIVKLERVNELLRRAAQGGAA